MSLPAASIIIPHFNGRRHLDDCLQSLRQQTWQDFEILLVDNGSTDGSQTYLRENFSDVELIELEENRGFTGACNAGWEAAQGEIIILLNNDTAVTPNWLAEIMQAFETYPQVGSVACKMLLYDRRDHFHTAGDYYRLDGIPGNRGVWQTDNGQYDQETTVFSACGGAAAYRQTMLAEIGFLDDDFFFSCEDVDLGWRINLSGWQVLYVPTAVVYHKLKATGGSETGSYYDGRNFLYLIWKNYPTPLFKKNWGLLLKAQLTITFAAIRAWRGTAARARLRGQLAGLWGIFKMWPKRKQIKVIRRIGDDTLTAVLTPVDETP
ncbi:MAG: glycosyltransferase family 2 protein [Chloroflexi bacterium]|nr:glycosyltransferase family 2 protein [Chloroflexota bacterium]